ncbi:MAG: DUF11 domain-containing protein [Phycisphaerales bacterium]|nr:DUF11 domain-containing protein [Phycisphaerales bacterium]
MKAFMTMTAAALLATSMLGCEQSAKRTGGGSQNYVTGYEGVHKPAPSKVEAAKPAPVKTEPARPAPVVTPGAVGVYYPTGRQVDAVLFIERMFPGEVAVGQAFDYMIRATNVSGIAVDDVIIDEMLPAGFKMSGSDPKGTAGAGNLLSFNLGRLNPGESRTIKISGAAENVGAVQSCATASYTIPVCQNIPVVQPALTITKAAPAEVMICDMIPVTIVVTNNGTGIAKNVKVSDALPAGLTANGSGTVNFDAGSLSAGQSREFKFDAKAAKTGSYNNVAKATADGSLSAESKATTTKVVQPVLTLEMECPPTGLILRDYTFKVTVCNKGDAVAAGTTVTANLPTGTVFVSADGGGTATGNVVAWNVGNLGINACKTYTFSVRANNAGDLPASASASATCAAAVSANCASRAVGVPDIGTGLEDDDGVVLVGQNHVFRYVVKNQGQVDLTNVAMSVSMDDGLAYVGTNFAGGAKAEGGKVTWKIGTLKPGQEIKFTFTAKGNAEGQFVVRAETTSDQTKLVRNDEQVHYVK